MEPETLRDIRDIKCGIRQIQDALRSIDEVQGSSNWTRKIRQIVMDEDRHITEELVGQITD